MAKFNLSGPIRLSVKARRIPGLIIELHLKRPTWQQADAMRRKAVEHSLRIRHIVNRDAEEEKSAQSLDQSKKKLSSKELRELEDERQKSLDLKKKKEEERTYEVLEARKEFEEEISSECLEEYVIGFTDRDEEGEVLLSDERGDVLCNDDSKRWKAALHEALYRGLADVWRQLLDLCSPTEEDVKFSEDLQKNSQKA